MKSFPKNFLWGASTAAHQVEGGTHNQWSVWELEHASELAKTAKARQSHLAEQAGYELKWEAIKSEATDPENYVSGRGVDHYRRYEEDFDLLQELNLNAYRFGIEWSRIEPEEGRWNVEAIEHYRQYIRSLRKRHIEPIITLWWWTTPIWFAERGEFEKAANIVYFERYVQKVIQEFGNDLRYVITINEPNVYTLFGYVLATRPPQQKSWTAAFKVMRNLVKAHQSAYQIIKQENLALRVGIAHGADNVKPKNPYSLSQCLSVRLYSYVANWWFLNRIRNHQDFVGVNYYLTEYKSVLPHKTLNPRYPTNDIGLYMEPEGLYEMLTQIWNRYHKPVLVTENGVPDGKDQYRRWWLEETMVALQKALSEGVDVRGYLHWSLLDNFDWDNGWYLKFGLVHVDRVHGMKRTVRDSARWYASFIARQRTGKRREP